MILLLSLFMMRPSDPLTSVAQAAASWENTPRKDNRRVFVVCLFVCLFYIFVVRETCHKRYKVPLHWGRRLQKSGYIPRLLSYLGVSGYYLVLIGGAFLLRNCQIQTPSQP